MQPGSATSGTFTCQVSYGHTETQRTPSLRRSHRSFCLASTVDRQLKPHMRLPPNHSYREQLMITLSSTRELAANNIRRAQRRYKQQYDKNTRPCEFRLGQWVFVKFSQDESGRLRKLSRPWHGPYRVINIKDPYVTVIKVYHPQHGEMQVHQTRVCMCPDNFPAGYYWYGGKQKGPG